MLIGASAKADQAQKQPQPSDNEVHELRAGQIDNLALFGKVWGYLKYHHPSVTRGCIDWDEELLHKVPTMLNAATHKQVVDDLVSWIGGLEGPDPCAVDTSKEQHFGPRTGWLEDQKLLGPKLGDLLRTFESPLIAVGQYYVTQHPGVGNPVFHNEPHHTDVDHLDWRYRLLALYRFWNIVEYWFPYRDVIETDWDSVLVEFLPRLYAAEDREAYLLELAMLVAKINDGHANLWDARDVRPPTGLDMPPFAIRIVEGKPFVWRRLEGTDTTPPDELQIGDVILAVDSKPVDKIFEEASPYYGASNDTSRLRQIGQYLLLGNGDSVLVKVERDGEVLDITTRRLPRTSLELRPKVWHDRDGETFQLLSDDIAYLKLSTIEINNIADYIKAAEGTKGLVIDIRSYPGSFVVFALGQHLVTTKSPFARFTIGDLSAPGSLIWTKPVAIEPADPHYNGKVVILVDGSSKSQSEYTAMAFRSAPEAIVVGSQTAGADGNVSRIPFPGGYTAGMSGIGVFYPDKSPTQRVGIVPDIQAKPTVAGLRAGRDEVLEVAIRQILGDDMPESEIRELAAMPR